MFLRSYCLAFISLLVPFADTQAQLAPGKDCYTFPAGGKAGTSFEVRLGGTDWTPDTQFVVYDSRTKLEVLGPQSEVIVPEPPFWYGIKSFTNDPRLPREIPVRLHVPADVPPGIVRWAAVNANGVGGDGVFVIGTQNEVTEDETKCGTEPQMLPGLPITINGRLRRIEERDRYQFRADATGLVTCDLLARRLGSEINAVVEIFEGEKKLTEAFDTEGVDSTLTFRVAKGKTYEIRVRDLDYRGFRNYTYRLQLTTGPRLVSAHPASGKRGEKHRIEFLGMGIATGQPTLESVSQEVDFPADAKAETFSYRLQTPHGTTQPYTFQLSDTADTPEAKEMGEKPQLVVPPLAIAGRISQRGERDVYSFQGKKGESWELSVQAKQIGSLIDPIVTIYAPGGKPLGSKDYFTTRVDPRLAVTLPVDGEYQVVIGDLSGKPPELHSVYRLVIRKPEPGFHLKTLGMLNLPIGGKSTLKVDVEREGGFKLPITLWLSGLPEGVSTPKEIVVAANALSVNVSLECDASSVPSLARVQVSGMAMIEDQPRTVRASHSTGDDSVPELLLATTMKPPFKVKSPEADGTRKAPRGATHLAELLIERSEGFTGEIVLDMLAAQSRHRQGITGPVFKIAPNQDRVFYPVTVPEWLESTRTSRISLAAMSKIPDAKGASRWVLAAMEGQVTMSIEGAILKLAHAADDLTATCGQTVEVPLKLGRGPQLSSEVRVELLVPRELSGLIVAEALIWPGDKPTAMMKLTTKNDARLVGAWTLRVRAVGSREGFPVVSETEIPIEFTKP
jgi:hypothetical protein